MRQHVFLSIFVAALALSSAALAQSGERVAGRRLATELCGECHEVRPPFPTFYRYKRPSTTSNHTIMPNFIVSKSDADDIITYILSLKRH
jgi:mono/diheme cytochrome c family protein